MESDKIGIGELARRSGLSVSALRFYDGAAVLPPAWVDEVTGYRFYRPDQIRDARLVADLRRVGMPVADIRTIVAASDDAEVVEQVLATHLRRLEDGLSDARLVLSAIRSRLDRKESHLTTTRLEISANELRTTLSAVRTAASTDPELPQLAGVLFDSDAETRSLRLVATDRYRLVVLPVEVSDHDGTACSVVVPSSLVDLIIEALRNDDSSVTVECTDDRIDVTSAAGATIGGPCLDVEFPDYRRLVRTDSPTQVSLDVDAFRAELVAAPSTPMTRTNDDVEYPMVVMTVATDGSVTVGAGGDEDGQIGVNREFLLAALDELAAPELTLGLDGPLIPLAIRNPHRPDAIALLMPVRLTEQQAS